jgi:hypothetical protein
MQASIFASAARTFRMEQPLSAELDVESKQFSYSEMKDDGSGCEEVHVMTDGVWLLGNTNDTSGGRRRYPIGVHGKTSWFKLSITWVNITCIVHVWRRAWRSRYNVASLS